MNDREDHVMDGSSSEFNAEQMRKQVEELEKELALQRSISYAAGLFQGDVTIRTLFESLAEAVVVVERSGRVIFTNERAQELFRYERHEMVGRPLDQLLPARMTAEHTRFLSTYFEDPRVRPMGLGRDLVARRRDGTEVPVEIGLSFLDTDAGMLGLAFLTDITERKNAERSLKLRNEELDAFAHTLAHELKSSLSVLVGYTEHLAQDPEVLTVDELRRELAILAQNGRKMSNIITELLLFVTVRKENVVFNLLSMDDIVHDSLVRVDHQIRERHATIVKPDAFPPALGHGPWVEEVWFNYLVNALHHGGQPPRIELGAAPWRDGYVRYWLKDNGPGISPEDRARLFTPHVRLTQARTPGHGLGLSIVKQIVDKLDGRCGVDSEAGAGSVFWFELHAPDQQAG